MFTIKYIYPHGQEMLAGPYEQVHAEWVDASGNSYDHMAAAKLKPEDRPPMFRAVYCHKDGDCKLTIGPNLPGDDPNERPSRQARVFVMNEGGATIAKYEL